jgi:predicted nucleic acid-binding protein
MSGKYLLDTNFIIYALNNGVTLEPTEYFVSIITEMELLSFAKLSSSEDTIIRSLLSNFEIVNIDTEIKNKAIELRKQYSMKLPDSIICATAISKGAILITDDKKLHGIEKLKSLGIRDFV